MQYGIPRYSTVELKRIDVDLNQEECLFCQLKGNLKTAISAAKCDILCFHLRVDSSDETRIVELGHFSGDRFILESVAFDEKIDRKTRNDASHLHGLLYGTYGCEDGEGHYCDGDWHNLVPCGELWGVKVIWDVVIPSPVPEIWNPGPVTPKR